MLTSLVLQLKATHSGGLPASLGRASQALLLRLVAEQDAALAATMHDGEGLRPYTVSNAVIGRRSDGSLRVETGDTGWVRFTGLTAAVSSVLQAVAAAPPASVELDGFPFAVTGTTLDPAIHPWAGQVSYSDLAARHLLAPGVPPRQVRLEFVAPTTFRREGRYLPLPLPELVFGGLLERWQAFAPVALSPEVRRFAAEAVVISQYDLRSRSLPSKDGGLLIGFTGEVTFSVLNRDRYWLSVLNLLAAYAFYCGVGYRVTAGLGQVRSVGTTGKPLMGNDRPGIDKETTMPGRGRIRT